MNLDFARELADLGLRRSWFRIWWEVKSRTGLMQTEPSVARSAAIESLRLDRLPFAAPTAVAAVRDLIAPTALAQLRDRAILAVDGQLLFFSRWSADAGSPIQWHRNPVTGQSWRADVPWYRLPRFSAGDIKFGWEVARFPHAYHLARAATFDQAFAARFADAFWRDVQSFIAANPPGYGVHWGSGQEVSVRLGAWLFALSVFGRLGLLNELATATITDALVVGSAHVEAHLAFARLAAYNNHLLSEALLLWITGTLVPSAPDATRWRVVGRAILDEQSSKQFYRDGGYLQQSHTYHRVALHNLIWAVATARAAGERVPESWTHALDRSLTFLLAHQEATDGRLPNYGNNDGALVSILSTSDYGDFRPVLQTASLLVRGERVYDAGPWDEEPVWWIGPDALAAPLRPPTRRTISFAESGHHVLRGEHSFCTFRCGTLRDRFTQIDMLHVDVWWKGQNVAVDAGTYLYNGEPRWHQHFTRTACHNTVQINGRDQMQHYRQFKFLHRTRARLLHCEDAGAWARCAGEHYGYQWQPGAAVHRRSVLFLKDDTWVVADRVQGEGPLDVRLHWLLGAFPYTIDDAQRLALDTPAGAFSLQVFDEAGHPQVLDVVKGDEQEPRGWLSRYYGERVAVPSVAVRKTESSSAVLITVLSGVATSVNVRAGVWSVDCGARRQSIRLDDGVLTVGSVAA